MSTKGQIVIPGVYRDKMGWRSGDHFEIVESSSEDSITLKKVANDADWVDTLLACPGHIQIPGRSAETYKPRS